MPLLAAYIGDFVKRYKFKHEIQKYLVEVETLVQFRLVELYNLYQRRGVYPSFVAVRVRSGQPDKCEAMDAVMSEQQADYAPGVEMFSINLTQSEELTDSIMRYIARGRNAGRLLDDDTDTGADRGSIYPSLKHFALGPFINSAAILKATLKAFQNVTRLDWETGLDAFTPIQSLMTDVAVCPQLEHLRVYGVSSDDLVAVVRARATNGRPLKIVELLKTGLVKFVRYVDEDEDTDSEDDDEDEDEDGSIDTASSDLSDTDGSGGEWEDVETDLDS
ncbi:hypothetical protein BDV93DRAFT_516669 [Ceratobasidium sp. AG-I]|nr:hypothetical protein BDV93DRAFT_516669 [Ceratobasidium sp. AG-I]